MKTDIDVNLEPLPGYRLMERLGTGGYGEVWSVEVPGGLTKAIKFVFGRQDEKRASHELRALDRVRSVRHPFLLSLERIEVVGGRLLVVTELADGSLKDRFDECRRQGLPGIPRAELLGYLRDAADALDFMMATQALGHLDIKPENMLLLAGHVKVADFGLVKDVTQSQASLVGGMTPLYAAPELFRGTPGPQSDQYSLAILYQEMLTGTLPFAGGNAAELTLQHLNDEAELSPLPPADRYAVSRALAKDPEHRYPTCRAFVDALVVGGQEQSGFQASHDDSHRTRDEIQKPLFDVHPTTSPDSPSRSTDVFDAEDSALETAADDNLLVDLPPQDARLIDLQPMPLDPQLTQPVPTLVLGIGGGAGRVLAHFRAILSERYGGAASLPAIQLLQIDTDARALADLTRHSSAQAGGLGTDETMTLPLRRPQHYRDQSQQLLRWLSRRWLYNIPRSLRTEGLRPLGRLALTDHARQTGQRIRRALIQAIDQDTVNISSQTLGRAFRSDAADVYVVATISGGTGSGMSLDLGYAARAILQRLGLAHANVTGIMMHATGGEPRHCELARVNAFAWLRELQHFRRSDASYPGDASCGYPSHPRGVAPFDHTYLVHLGDNLDATEFDAATRSVAEYLHWNALSPARAFFETHRSAAPDPEQQLDPNQTIRSFGILRRSSAAAASCDGLANLVSERVLTNWKCGQNRKEEAAKESGLLRQSGPGPANAPSSTGQQESGQGAHSLIRRLQLDADGIFSNSRALVELHLKADAASFLTSWLDEHSDAKNSDLAGALSAVNRIFAAGQGELEDKAASFLLGQPVTAIVGPLEEKLRMEMRRWIVRRVDEPRERLGGTRRALAWLSDHLQAVDAELNRLDRSIASRLRDAKTSGAMAAEADEEHPRPARRQFLLDYFRLQLDQSGVRAAIHAVRLMRSDMKVLSDELTALGREFDQMETTLGCNSAESTADDPPSGPEKAKALTWLRPQLGELAELVERRLQAECLREAGLWQTIMQGGRPRAQLCLMINEFSSQAVQRCLAGVNVLDDLAQCGTEQAQSTLRSNLAAATPTLLELGGTRRVLAILPKDSASNETTTDLSRLLGIGVNTVTGCDNSLTLCVEADALSVRHIALNLVQRRRDRVEFAGRAQSRMDIEWTPLLPQANEASPGAWSQPGASPLQADPAVANTMVM